MNVRVSIRNIRLATALIGGLFAVIAAGCGGGAKLTPDCDTIRGVYGGTGGGANGGLQVYVYSLTNCDLNGNNCTQIQVSHTTTDSQGNFSINGLPFGNYLVIVYDASGTNKLSTNKVNIPNVCYGTGVTQLP